MYDTLNGHQIKTFPWYSCECNTAFPDDIPIISHAGGLMAYHTGDSLPFRSVSYNYTPDFAILDIHPDNEYLDWMVHIVKNGKYVKTFSSIDYLPSDEATLKESKMVIGMYGGNNMKIRSIDDIVKYKEELAEMTSKSDKIRENLSVILVKMRESTKELESCEKGSEKYVKIKENLDAIDKEYEAEVKRRNPELDKILNDFRAKWFDPVSEEEEDYFLFGKYLQAGMTAMSMKRVEDINSNDDFSFFCDCFLKKYGDKVNEEFLSEYFNQMGIEPGENMYKEVTDLLYEIKKYVENK